MKRQERRWAYADGDPSDASGAEEKRPESRVRSDASRHATLPNPGIGARIVNSRPTSKILDRQTSAARTNVRRRPSSRIVRRPSSSAASIGSMVPVASVSSRQ